MSCLTARADKEAVTRGGHNLAVRSTACDDGVAGQLHQTGAQATAASARSVLATELSLSQALMAPANP